ncbi:hypothetical protein PYCCODRAFT_1432456 [Trametes coccinea BRFM310]|uniref:Uncharacterized protein n=1 Tax=Trametes coccinea (strain BRFM310) TaxID=1353009 RepID=A0A1Y2IVZ0_TRAC3|nr:hypothetical protein PYCCODRAFT_1432456 [Trametes coccinea BRFM310]
MSSPPKSCLKRNSISTTDRPFFLDGLRSDSPFAAFEFGDTASESTSDRSASPCELSGFASYEPPSSSNDAAPRERRKSVTFCEDDEVRFIYPIKDPLSKQARKQAKRIFKACAEALRIDSPYSPPGSRRGSVSSVESVEEEEEEDEA